MQPTPLLTAALVAILAAAVSPARVMAAAAAAPAVDQRAQWTLQSRAADAIGEVLMAASERAEAQVDLLRRKLSEAGEKPAPAARHAPATSRATSAPAAAPARDTQTAYRKLHDQVVAAVRRGGANQIDPSLQGLTDDQLFAEMAALQSYNLRTFRRLEDLRGQAADLRARLEAHGRWNGEPTTQPAIATPQDVARAAIEALGRAQRVPRWADARQKMRNALVASRAQQRRDATPHASPPSTAYAPPAGGIVIEDPRWQPYYYGPGDALTGWGDPNEMFADPFHFRGGGGVYLRNDTRVNADFDTRTHGQSDRRVNVEFDRRLNLHVDPRENF